MTYLGCINQIEKNIFSVRFVIGNREYTETIDCEESELSSKVAERMQAIKGSHNLKEELYVKRLIQMNAKLNKDKKQVDSYNKFVQCPNCGVKVLHRVCPICSQVLKVHPPSHSPAS